MNGTGPGVACGDAVAAIDLQVVQESGYPFGCEVGHLQPFDRALGIGRYELQQQQHGIAVTAHRVRAQAPLARQELFEEAHQLTPKIGWCGRFHVTPPSIMPAHDRSKRADAWDTTAGIQRR